MKDTIKQIIESNLPEKKEITKCRMGDYYEDENWAGFNQALSQINTSLIADEVLKVVVEKIEMLYGDIVTTKKDIAIPHNCIEYETALDDIINIINNLKS
jgi:hypothetical protein